VAQPIPEEDNGARSPPGFCLGGGREPITRPRIFRLTAGVVFYGIPPEQAAKPAAIKFHCGVIFANKDDWCPPSLVDAFATAMKLRASR